MNPTLRFEDALLTPEQRAQMLRSLNKGQPSATDSVHHPHLSHRHWLRPARGGQRP